MIKKLSQKITDYIGGWAYFFGSVMAQGFDDAMEEMGKRDQALLDAAQEEKNKLPDIGVN